MNKLLTKLSAPFVLLLTLILTTIPAGAWTFDITGQGSCQKDGSFLITWTVDNSKENQPLHITKSSNTAVVSDSTNIAADSSETFNQTVNGATATSYDLTLTGNWNGDKELRMRSATVSLSAPCTQPTPPTVPTTAPPVVTPTAPTPSVTPPPVTPIQEATVPGFSGK